MLDTAEHEDDEDEKNFYKQSAQSMRERYDILFDVERYEVSSGVAIAMLLNNVAAYGLQPYYFS